MTNNKQCYALVLYTYDEYEWEQVFAVSFDKELLSNYYKNQKPWAYSDLPLLEENEHKLWRSRQNAHWTIENIKFLEK